MHGQNFNYKYEVVLHGWSITGGCMFLQDLETLDNKISYINHAILKDHQINIRQSGETWKIVHIFFVPI